MEFANSWIWLIFTGVGLLLIALEIILGVVTGFDLVMIGSALIFGGLISLPFHSWIVAVIITCVLCILYFIIGRRYIHRISPADKTSTNVDAIVGKHGIVSKAIPRASTGLVQVGGELWRAEAETELRENEEIEVTGIHGVTLIVKKVEGS